MTSWGTRVPLFEALITIAIVVAGYAFLPFFIDLANTFGSMGVVQITGVPGLVCDGEPFLVISVRNPGRGDVVIEKVIVDGVIFTPISGVPVVKPGSSTVLYYKPEDENYECPASVAASVQLIASTGTYYTVARVYK